jgi:hypothetical protein
MTMEMDEDNEKGGLQSGLASWKKTRMIMRKYVNSVENIHLGQQVERSWS